MKTTVFRAFVFITVAALSGLAQAADRGPAADLIITHARVWTVNPAQPEAAAVAVLNGRIVAVGSDQEVARWRGAQTQVVDAGGRRLVPGFNDSHVHLLDGGESMEAVQLNDATSNADFVRRLAAYAAKLPKGDWIRGGEWDETKWLPAELPTRQQIDAATPDNPVSIDRYDGHMVLANARALALAGITRATLDPAGGVIVRDAQGEPTGALKDAATELINKVIPAPNREQRRRAMANVLREAARLGVTSAQAMSADDDTLTTLREFLN